VEQLCSFHFDQDKTKFTTLPASSKAPNEHSLSLFSQSFPQTKIRRDRQTDGREMKFEFYLIRSLHSYMFPEGHKNYFTMSHFIQMRPNKLVKL
jgi:hypothetical protein